MIQNYQLINDLIVKLEREEAADDIYTNQDARCFKFIFLKKTSNEIGQVLLHNAKQSTYRQQFNSNVKKLQTNKEKFQDTLNRNILEYLT